MSAPIESLAQRYSEGVNGYLRLCLYRDDYVRILNFKGMGSDRERQALVPGGRELPEADHSWYRTYSGFALMGEREYLAMVNACRSTVRQGEMLSPIVVTTDEGFILQLVNNE